MIIGSSVIRAKVCSVAMDVVKLNECVNIEIKCNGGEIKYSMECINKVLYSWGKVCVTYRWLILYGIKRENKNFVIFSVFRRVRINKWKFGYSESKRLSSVSMIL